MSGWAHVAAGAADVGAGVVNAIAGGGTLISFRHTVVGPFPEEHRGQIGTGWKAMHARVKRVAERVS